jgi:hypothetical protein
MSVTTVRSYERIGFVTELEVVDLAGENRWAARSVDLSRGGLGFFCRKFISTGTRVKLAIRLRRLPVGGSSQPVQTAYVTGMIVHSRIEDEGAIMGCKFDKDLSPSEQPLLCGCADKT